VISEATSGRLAFVVAPVRCPGKGNRTRFDHNFAGRWLRCTQAVVLNQKFHARYVISDVVSDAWDWRVVCLLQNRKYWRFS
jgi:hypothetical protein